MQQIVILTATYNHPQELLRLFESLKNQTDKDFRWIIVNDGSEEETEKVLKLIGENEKLNTQIINKTNGGKSSSINKGLDNIDEDVEFVLIVDDDERLYAESMRIVREYVYGYRDTKCGVIHFNRKNEKGEVIAIPPIQDDFYMSYQQFKSEGRWADGYIGYFTKKLGDIRFDIFPGEKYIGPSTLIMKACKENDLLWAKAIIGVTEYLDEGITKLGRKLRVKNPNGMIEYCELMQEGGASFKTKIVYSIQGYAYAYISKNKYVGNRLQKIGAIPGAILGRHWERKYII